MNINEVRKTVARIKSSLFRNSNSYSIGMLRSHFKGTGLQFKEHQVYVPGDDVRFIDWKLLAKTAEPYIKTFDEERNVEIVVVIDASPTMFFGDKGVTKIQASIELCCLLYLLAAETNDYVHALVVTDKVINVPKRNGDGGIVALISTLEKNGILNEKGEVDLSFSERMDEYDEVERYNSIMKHVGRKREVVLLSDFNGLISTEHLKRVIYQKNVHCFQILSPIDYSLSVPYLIKSTGQESGKSRNFGVNFKRSDFEGLLGKRVKNLEVGGRYLEDFIKEMV